MASSPINQAQTNQLFHSERCPADLETMTGPMTLIQKVDDLFKFANMQILYKTSNQDLIENTQELYKGFKIGRIVMVDGKHFVLHKQLPSKVLAASACLLSDELLKNAAFYVRVATSEEQIHINALRRV